MINNARIFDELTKNKKEKMPIVAYISANIMNMSGENYENINFEYFDTKNFGFYLNLRWIFKLKNFIIKSIFTKIYWAF